MSRAPYRTRMYVVACKRCTRWYSVKTLAEQAKAKQRGTCMKCEDERIYRLELYKSLIKQHMTLIAAKAGRLPEAERAVYRALYRQRQRQWRWCVEQLEPAEVH